MLIWIVQASHSQEEEWEPVTFSDEEEKNAVLNAPHPLQEQDVEFFEELYVSVGQFSCGCSIINCFIIGHVAYL